MHLLLSVTKPTTPVREADDVARKIEQGLPNGDCTFSLPVDEAPNQPPTSGVDLDLKSSHLEIKGERCPLAAVIDIKASKNGPHIDADVVMSFTAKTADMQKEMGATHFSLTGQLKGLVEQNGNQGAHFGLTAALSGQGDTLSNGAFSAVINYEVAGAFQAPPPNSNGSDLGDFFQMRMSESQAYDFGQERTALSSSIDMKGFSNITSHFFVNGSEVSAEQYQKYASEITLPGAQNPGGPSTHPPSHSSSAMNCVLEVYDATQVSVVDLQKFVSGGSRPTPRPLQALSACARSTSTQLDFHGQPVKLAIHFTPDFVQAEVSRGTLLTPIFAQNDDTTQVAGQTSDVTHLLICAPVEQCSF